MIKLIETREITPYVWFIRTRRGSDLVGHPSAILILPAAVKRMPP
jgi:hypothetical protein